MRENRLSGLEGGVAFGPSLPLSGERSAPAARGSPSRSASDKLRRSADKGACLRSRCCGSESRGPAELQSFRLWITEFKRIAAGPRISRFEFPLSPAYVWPMSEVLK